MTSDHLVRPAGALIQVGTSYRFRERKRGQEFFAFLKQLRTEQRPLAELDRVGVHPLRYFTLDGSAYPSHNAQEAAIAGYIRWANKHAKPQRRFAVDSKIRRPDYLPNVA